MKSLRSAKNSARMIVTAGLAMTASTLALTAGAFAQQAGQGRIELAQRGPGAGEELTPEERARRREQRQQRREQGDPGAGQRQPRGGGPGGAGEGPRTRGQPRDAMPPAQQRIEPRQAPTPPPRVEQPLRQVPPPRVEQQQRQAPPPPRVEQAPVQQRDPSLFGKQLPNREELRERRRERIETQRDRRQEHLQDRRERIDTQRDRRQENLQDRRERIDTQRDRRQERFEERHDRIETQRDRRQERFEERRDRIETQREGRRDRREWRREQRESERSGGFTNIDALRKNRRERTEGGRTIYEEPDARRIVRSGNNSYIIRDETRRLKRFGRVAESRRRPGGGNVTEVIRPNGARIFTETSPDGRLIRRYRRTHDGRTIMLIDNRRTWRKWGAIGAGAVLATGLLLALDPPHYRIPRDRYIVEYDRASDDDIYEALSAPPLDDVEGDYTLDHVLFNYNLRARMRRVDLDTINFDTGAWDIDESQYDKLERLARAIDRVIQRNPDEVFLIEGHTDAIGDPVSNRSLSDRRAEEVANILSEEFDIPPENLVIQGYGEEFLKVDTDAPSRANRRVTVRRITPLIGRRSAGYRDR